MAGMNKPSYWLNITDIYERQTQKGVSEYGQRIEDNDSVSFDDMITMAEEELIDSLVYLEWIRDKAHSRGIIDGKDETDV